MFKAEKTANEIIEFIREYYKKNNLKGAVIGISGGKDSAVVAGLFTKALGNENVIGIWMPCHSKEEDKQNAIELSEHFGFELKEFDLTNIYDNYVGQFKNINNPNEINLKDANINIKPRLRTSTLYYYAAYLSKANNGGYIVPGTSNKCEIYVGYFTKGGDNVADIQILADLTVEQVIEVGQVIGVPEHIVNKMPDDGLSGISDEEKLGVKYNEIADVIENNGKNTKKETRDKIEKLHQNNLHKFNTATYRKKE